MSLTTPLLAYLGSRLRFLLLWLVLLGVYAAVGSLLIPYLAQTRWLPELARQHQIAIKAKDISFDPLGFGVELREVTVNDATGQPFISAHEVSVDLNLISSLKHFHPALSVELDAPFIRLDRDKKGQWNLAGLWPPKAQSKSEGFPVALTQLSLNHGQVEFCDALRGKSVSTRFTDVALMLKNFPGDAANHATYWLAAKGPGQESFASEGTLLLDPMTVAGSLTVEQLYLPFWLDALPSALPWRVATGQLTSQLRFHMPAENEGGVALDIDQLLLTGLNAMDRQNPSQWIRAGRIELDKTRLGTEIPPLSLGSLRISGVESPWGKFGSLKMGRIAADPSGPNFRSETVGLENLELKEGKISSIMAGTLVYDAKNRQLHLTHVTVPAIDFRWGALAGYDEAAAAYRNLAQSGHDGADVLFDWGTSALKAGRRGEAVLALERALLQAPDDADVAFNLEEARKGGIDKVEGAQEFEPMIERLGRALPIGPLAALFLGAWGLFFGAWALRLWRGEGLGPISLVAGPVAFVSGAGLWLAAQARTASIHAVVTAPTASVREGPGEAFKAAFEVHEGLKVRVLGRDDGHLHVRLSNGAEGWLAAREAGEIERASSERTP